MRRDRTAERDRGIGRDETAERNRGMRRDGTAERKRCDRASFPGYPAPRLLTPADFPENVS